MLSQDILLTNIVSSLSTTKWNPSRFSYKAENGQTHYESTDDSDDMSKDVDAEEFEGDSSLPNTQSNISASSEKDMGSESDTPSTDNSTQSSMHAGNASLGQNVYSSGYTNWSIVSVRMKGERSPIQCRNRWNLALKPKLFGAKHGTWTQIEDATLMKAVMDVTKESMGIMNSDVPSLALLLDSASSIVWTKVSAILGNRTSVQCRNRFVLLAI